MISDKIENSKISTVNLKLCDFSLTTKPTRLERGNVLKKL